jgi:pimeloyl-ACP methyl ester carboxylesterase
VNGVVLVHGGLHSAACWDPVRKHLRAPAVAVDLPGRASRPAELAAVDLADCVNAVIDSADEAGFDRFVLVGHSIGGVTITETAWCHPQRVTHLAYVGAIVPARGMSASTVMTGVDLPPADPVVVDQALAKTLFANDLTDQQWNEYWQGSVPEAAGIMNARLSGYPQDIPATYISMTDDVPVPPALAEQMIANLGARVDHRAISGGHLVMASKPRELAAVINELAQARPSR